MKQDISAKKSRGPQRLNILLVEDAGQDREAFHRAFRGCSAPYRLTDCLRASEALALIKRDPSAFDAAVIGHHLPDMSGLDLCKELLAASVPLPLVILIDSGSERLAVEALRAGVNSYIIRDPGNVYLELLPMVLDDVAEVHWERKEREEAEVFLRESKDRLRYIIEGITIPTFVINRDHITTHWNQACANITGVPAAEIIGTRQQWRAFYKSERPVMADLIIDAGIEDMVERHYGRRYRRSEIIDDAFEAEDFFPHFGEAGKWLYFTAAPLRDSNGTVIGAIETLQDVSERRKAELALKESERLYRNLSITDGLTGLYNSRHFFGRAKEEILRCNRYSSTLSLILLDVDNFKVFNDTYGHIDGDRVLASLADVIRAGIREVDTAYRYGGEEFIVIFPETEPEEARMVAERLRSTFEQTTFSPLPGSRVNMTISIGGGCYHAGEDLTMFVKRIDDAMYTAKSLGKNRVVFV